MLRIKNILISGLVLSLLIVECGQKQEQPEFDGKDDTVVKKESKKIIQEQEKEPFTGSN